MNLKRCSNLILSKKYHVVYYSFTNKENLEPHSAYTTKSEAIEKLKELNKDICGTKKYKCKRLYDLPIEFIKKLIGGGGGIII